MMKSIQTSDQQLHAVGSATSKWDKYPSSIEDFLNASEQQSVSTSSTSSTTTSFRDHVEQSLDNLLKKQSFEMNQSVERRRKNKKNSGVSDKMSSEVHEPNEDPLRIQQQRRHKYQDDSMSETVHSTFPDSEKSIKSKNDDKKTYYSSLMTSLMFESKLKRGNGSASTIRLDNEDSIIASADTVVKINTKSLNQRGNEKDHNDKFKNSMLWGISDLFDANVLDEKKTTNQDDDAISNIPNLVIAQEVHDTCMNVLVPITDNTTTNDTLAVVIGPQCSLLQFDDNRDEPVWKINGNTGRRCMHRIEQPIEGSEVHLLTNEQPIRESSSSILQQSVSSVVVSPVIDPNYKRSRSLPTIQEEDSDDDDLDTSDSSGCCSSNDENDNSFFTSTRTIMDCDSFHMIASVAWMYRDRNEINTDMIYRFMNNRNQNRRKRRKRYNQYVKRYNRCNSHVTSVTNLIEI